MKKRLQFSLIATAIVFLLCSLSDSMYHTQYMGETFFQPFPHLIILLLLICDLFFWYKVRVENRSRAKGLMQEKTKKSCVDVGILWTLMCLIGVTMAFICEFLLRFI